MQITKDITPIEIADKILLHFDDNVMTDFDTAAHNAGITYDLINELELNRKYAHAKNILSDSLQYIEVTGNGNTWFFLTDLGRQVKKAGGHSEYLKKLEAKKLADLVRQERKDKADELDLQIKTWQVKTKYLPYIASFFALTISIFSYFKPERKQLDLQQVQQDLQQLKENEKKQDSLFQLNIHQTKDKR